MLHFLSLLALISALPQADDPSCYDSSPGPHVGFTIAGSETGDRCLGLFYCEQPELGSPTYEVLGGCNPQTQSCTVRASVPAVLPGNSGNTSGSPASVVVLQWWSPQQGAAGRGGCGSFGNKFLAEKGNAWIEIGFSCDTPDESPWDGEYELAAIACFGSIDCEKTTLKKVHLTGPYLAAHFCPEPPPQEDCQGPSGCQLCKTTGGGIGAGAASAAGDGGTAGGPGTGPGVQLRYKAGGVGHPGLPGSSAWATELGRYWSHDYAERIFEDADPSPAASKVYLVTAAGVYQTFTDLDGDTLYEGRQPASVYETLELVRGIGWQLTYLDGTLKIFDEDGRWTSTADRFGNTKTATYDSGRLSRVDFPDGRHEEFSYHPSGKLAAVEEVGVEAGDSRQWSYTWTGDDLTRVDLPDGRALEYFYTDLAHPGFMTRTELIGDDGSTRRVTAGWEYDTRGNATRIWKGATTFAAGVEKWQFQFDDPFLPRETTMVDPLGNSATYFLDGDRASRTAKARLVKLTGDCPTCGTGPNSQLFYGDAANPFRVTRELNGRGYETRSAFTTYGQVAERIEAFGSPAERTTSWAYDANYPGLWTSIEQPSTTGEVTEFRRTERVFDAGGRLTSETVEGIEAGETFSLTTVVTPTTEGMPATIDPPGYGITDRTSFTYDPDRGNLVALTRTEPLVGETTYGYDAFNRRTSITDVNGIVTETAFDDGDRVLTETRLGAAPAEDLVTESRYDTFGDLFQTILPAGNVIEYGYDAAGRLISVERKPDPSATSHGERTFYTLNGAGQRTLEQRQRWDGSAWVTVSQTAWQYSSRCRLDKTIEGVAGEQSVTEQAYDCGGNVVKVWDANHPSGGQVATPSASYQYDELDRLVLARQPFGGAGGGNADTSYVYDDQDHLIQVTDANGTVTGYVWSDRDVMTREVSEVTGATNSTYNEHGQLTVQLDARGIATIRTVDELDRVGTIDLPGTALDTVFTYDDPLVPFSKGRLTSIVRDGTRINYGYDRFGRTIRDGGIGYGLDKNGNAATMTYPGGLVATYTHDYADRPKALTVAPSEGAPQAIVTAAAYRPFGPLSSLTLGNGLTETRDYDSRGFPKRILVPGKLDWSYTVDAIGNPTAIADSLVPANNKAYAYQSFQYFLTSGNGPWGTRAWTYDKAGNRLTETRSGVTDAYTYVLNAAGARSPKIQQVSLGGGGVNTYVYDSTGNETQAGPSTRTFDSAGRLSSEINSQVSSTFKYDGRGFLAEADENAPAGSGTGIFCDSFESGNTSQWGGSGSPCFERTVTFPTYASEGRLESIQSGGTQSHILYFDHRPVTVAEKGSAGVGYLFLSVDPIGTPVLATSVVGTVIWGGGFEPFGRDWNHADSAGVFLRFPGQWRLKLSEAAYNLFRWYGSTTGRYSTPDPRGTVWGDRHAYRYANASPLSSADPMGLKTCVVFSLSNVASVGKYGLFRGDHVGVLFDGSCSKKPSGCSGQPPSLYDPSGSYLGNSMGSSRFSSFADLNEQGVPASAADYLQFQCTSPNSLVEVACFDTSCCEEDSLATKMVNEGGDGAMSCSSNTSKALSGVGPFKGLTPTGWPPNLRRQIHRLVAEGLENRSASLKWRSCGDYGSH